MRTKRLFEGFERTGLIKSSDSAGWIMDIKEIIDSDFRGNIYVVQDGKVIIENVSGFADLANEIPNTLETKFASASAGKVFVAVAILQLIEQGKLNFDDTLGKLLDIDLHDIDADVTVEQLLNHTSGVPDYLMKALWTNTRIYGLIFLITKSDITMTCSRCL